MDTSDAAQVARWIIDARPEISPYFTRAELLPLARTYLAAANERAACGNWSTPLEEPASPVEALLIESHEIIDGEQPTCIGQWCCGCPEHPIGKPWGWNSRAWSEHYRTCPKSEALEHVTIWGKGGRAA